MGKTSTSQLTSPADKTHGYKFGCDGVVSVKEARVRMGKVSKATIYRRFAEGVIRRGRDGGRAIVCLRSLTEYLSQLET